MNGLTLLSSYLFLNFYLQRIF